jgi:hypothetical protein
LSRYLYYIKLPWVKRILLCLLFFGTAIYLANKIVAGGIFVSLVLIALPFGLMMLYRIFATPDFGMIIILYIAFLVNAFGRYMSLPFGLSLDAMLILTMVSAIFKVKNVEVARLKNGLILFMSLWTLFTVFEIFNPEAHSFEAWFYAVRSISFYLLFLIILTFLIFNKQKNLDSFIVILLVGSSIAALYGMKQLYIGLNVYEKYWLDAGAAKTHLLFGKLRVFSFFSDAGQFGAFMAYAALIGGILALNTESKSKRIFYVITGLISLYGMMISGTRGAMFVLAGFLFYLLLTKNFKVFLLGMMVAGTAFFILKYTYLGQGNYQVQRMRSALDINDPSFQVRLENQRKLAQYLDSRPFGGGIGTIGFWGQRFSPGTYLAEMPPDSYYVRIWAETGVVGLILHILVLVYIMVISFMKVFNLRDPILKQKMMALYAGAAGLLIASYGNQIISQVPSMVFISISFAFFFHSPEWDKEAEEIKGQNVS